MLQYLLLLNYCKSIPLPLVVDLMGGGVADFVDWSPSEVVRTEETTAVETVGTIIWMVVTTVEDGVVVTAGLLDVVVGAVVVAEAVGWPWSWQERRRWQPR